MRPHDFGSIWYACLAYDASMDFKQIAYFVQVAELSSFTRASSVLRVAQPALSRQVRALEVELRQSLFDRNGRGVTLTEAGKRLLAHGRGILQQVQRAQQDMEDERGAPLGQLALGLPPSVSRTLTAPWVQAFRKQFPKAGLTMVEGLSTYLLDWLVQGRIDCAVVYNATPAAAIELLPVLNEPLYWVSSRKTSGATKRASGSVSLAAVSLAEVARHELVIPSRPHSIRMLLETTLAGASLKAQVVLEIESVPAILDLVERYPLHAVLGLNALAGRQKSFVARPIRVGAGKPALATSLSIATSAQRPRGALLEQASALLQQKLLALWT
jgi:LysR family transcriptional regulator, nitrogen assimilation regulatory protein